MVKKEVHLDAGPEYHGTVTEEPEEYEFNHKSVELQEVGLNSESQAEPRWGNAVHHQRKHYSLASEGTLFSSSSRHSQDTLCNAKDRRILTHSGCLHQLTKGIFAVLERVLVMVGFAQLLLGIVTYSGVLNLTFHFFCA